MNAAQGTWYTLLAKYQHGGPSTTVTPGWLNFLRGLNRRCRNKVRPNAVDVGRPTPGIHTCPFVSTVHARRF